MTKRKQIPHKHLWSDIQHILPHIYDLGLHGSLWRGGSELWLSATRHIYNGLKYDY